MGRERRMPASTAVLAAALTAVMLTACSPPPPDTLGPTENGLAPCPASGGCVHTGLRRPEGTKGLYLIGRGRLDDVVAGINDEVEALPGTTVVATDGLYLHAEARTPILGLVDDLEVLIMPDAEVVVRAQRRGRMPDFGANARRVEELRQRLLAASLVMP